MLNAFHHEIDNRLRCVDDAVRVFCFPVAVGQFEGINDFAVWGDPSFLWCIVCLFAEAREIGLVAVMLEQTLECGTDGDFILFAEPFIFFQFGVVVLDGFVRGFDVDIRRRSPYILVC